MKHFVLLSILFFFKFYSFTQTTKIAFGSCSDEDDTLEIFNEVLRHQPNYYVFLGDNIYADTKIMDTLKTKYQRLGNQVAFQNLMANTQVLATWDDHDFGANDAGKYYDCKNESKKIFLDFFKEDKQSERWNHDGIYTSKMEEINGKKLQFIILDERTFRNDLKLYNQIEDGYLNEDGRFWYHLDYAPIQNPDSTILGKEQWLWLENELSKPADVRIICSGTQFGITYNGYEAWANYPREQEKMLELIKKTQANGVMFISGDVHYSEISKLNHPGLYPIYDVTSSGISETWKFAAPNTNRIEGPVMDNNFGLITIDWGQTIPLIQLEIWDKTGNQRVEYSFPLSDLKFQYILLKFRF